MGLINVAHASTKYGVIVDGFAKDYYERNGKPKDDSSRDLAFKHINTFCDQVRNMKRSEFEEHYELYFEVYGDMQPVRKKK